MPDSATRDSASSARRRILVIDDEATVCLSCMRILTAEGHQVDSWQDPREGLRAAVEGDYDIILLDLVMPEMDGLEVLGKLKEAGVLSEIIIITGYSTVDTAVRAMKLGAADYVSKPFTPEELTKAVVKVLERSSLMRENAALRRELDERRGFEGIVGESRAMEKVFSLIKRVAPSDGTVLITGESGTGKEMVARVIHRLSPRKDHLFLACDCTALAPTLLESELFGHVKGSFSGAIATKLGLFEAADKGSLFLDEVANITLETQGKLLRVLESRQVKRVGDTSERQVDIRLIAATNKDLGEMVRDETFRKDLFYRLNVVPITVPPLRERQGDIPFLAMTFLEQYRKRSPVAIQGFAPEAMRLLERYAWPGNVRELKNIVERLAILCDVERIDIQHLPPEVRGISGPVSVQLPESWAEFRELKRQVREGAVDDLERRFLMQALARTGGNVSKASEAVGMQRTNFHALMRKHGLGSPGEE
jgi:DNA-binding NtrC family response regulator